MELNNIVLVVNCSKSCYFWLHFTVVTFSILRKGLTDGINDSVPEPKRKFSIGFTQKKTRFCLSLHYKGGNSYLYVNKKEICKFKVLNDIISCLFQLRSVL